MANEAVNKQGGQMNNSDLQTRGRFKVERADHVGGNLVSTTNEGGIIMGGRYL